MSNLHSWVRPMKIINPKEVYIGVHERGAANWKLVWIVHVLIRTSCETPVFMYPAENQDVP